MNGEDDWDVREASDGNGGEGEGDGEDEGDGEEKGEEEGEGDGDGEGGEIAVMRKIVLVMVCEKVMGVVARENERSWARWRG